VLASRAGTKLTQNIASLVARHIDVEEQEIGAARRRVSVGLLEKPNDLLAIIGDIEICFNA